MSVAGQGGSAPTLPRKSAAQSLEQYLNVLAKQIELQLQAIGLQATLPALVAALPGAPPPGGGAWNNNGVLCIAPGTGGGEALPTTAPAAGSGLLWNNHGVVSVA